MTIQDKLREIKRLTAEVEAEVSKMGGVGAATETKKKRPTDKTLILNNFYKSIKR